MTETTLNDTAGVVRQSLARRYAAERRFRLLGISAIAIGIAFVLMLFVSIVGKGYTAFMQTQIQLEINFDPEVIDPDGSRKPEALASANYAKLYRDALKERFGDVSGRRELRELYNIVSNGATYTLRDMVMENPSLIGTRQTLWLIADDEIDMLNKGYIDRNVPASDRRVSDRTIEWVEQLEKDGQVRTGFS